MTPELLLQSLLEDIYIQLTFVEGDAKINLLTNDYQSFSRQINLLNEIAALLGIDTNKYFMKGG